mmetsp:Transcript_43511/g.139857  ORF Transcript_43511/g.139857 Transcript_43511/m.139857 type:complete len:110 (+) Transcript_43511:279-608(+)
MHFEPTPEHLALVPHSIEALTAKSIDWQGTRPPLVAVPPFGVTLQYQCVHHTNSSQSHSHARVSLATTAGVTATALRPPERELESLGTALLRAAWAMVRDGLQGLPNWS